MSGIWRGVKCRSSETPYSPVLGSSTRKPLKSPEICSAAAGMPLYATMQKGAPIPATSPPPPPPPSTPPVGFAPLLLDAAPGGEFGSPPPEMASNSLDPILQICDPNSSIKTCAAACMDPARRQLSQHTARISSSPTFMNSFRALVATTCGWALTMCTSRMTCRGSRRDTTNTCTASTGAESQVSRCQCTSGPCIIVMQPFSRSLLSVMRITGGGGTEKSTFLPPDLVYASIIAFAAAMRLARS
mmetsp:Transcript_14954/g.36190  ORF Transcript_14954/g.36190 Transcript_14954/m.36190 type:complete len:244 (-) Transcript_14954:438-1169(-)